MILLLDQVAIPDHSHDFYVATPAVVMYTNRPTLSLHDARPIWQRRCRTGPRDFGAGGPARPHRRAKRMAPALVGPARHIAAAGRGHRAAGCAGDGGHGSPRHQGGAQHASRSEEHTSELQSLMRISYAVFCLKKKNIKTRTL